MSEASGSRLTRGLRGWAGWLVVLAATSCGETWTQDDSAWFVLDQPSATELVVETVFGGSSCTRFVEWAVEESTEAVDIRAVIERSDAPDCTADEVRVEERISFDAPLGTRELRGCQREHCRPTPEGG